MPTHPPRLRAALVLLAALAAPLVVGCAGFVPQTGPEPEKPGRYVELTRPITAVGDTQEHEATGYPLHDNDSAIDAYVEVTQRPPEQPLFGRRILETVLRKHPDDPWLHLGDLLDLSCQSEAQRMNRILLGSGRHGAVLPGNHDGLMFGIYNYNLFDALLDPGAAKWELACRRGTEAQDARKGRHKGPLNKRDFIAAYLRLQATGTGALPGLAAPPAQGDFRLGWRHPDPRAFVSGIEARLVDGQNYASSFLAQRLKLPAAQSATRSVVIIGLDTNQAGALVGTWDTILGRSPGSVGHVRLEQVRAVTPWVLEAASNGDIVVFAGHHNWGSLGLPSRTLLRGLMGNLAHPLVYLSAHTHRGFWAVHRALDRRPLLELNVSSLSDWPIAYRRISFAYDEQANRLLVRGDLMPRGDRAPATDDDLMAAWTDQTCAQAGIDVARLRVQDLELVKRQRASRGSLIDWLREELSVACEDCEQSRLARAQAYQDEMLEALREVGAHLGPRAHGLAQLRLPTWCAPGSYADCAVALLASRPTDLKSQRTLFRRKAQLVSLVGEHLDDLDSPDARTYMTCRAVQAARLDFDVTEDDRNDHRGESKRRLEQFFRTEASVGID